MNQDNPFAKLGALDQKLYQETTPKPPAKSQNIGMSANQHARKPESQNTGMLENQKAGKPESQNTGILENQKTVKRATYPKITYRICPEAVNAIEDTKHILKREYQIKANLEEIAEEAIIKAYHDLLENQKSSNLVTQLSRKPEIQ